MLKLQEGIQYKVISIGSVPKIIAALTAQPVPLGLDLETTGLNCRRDKIVTLQFGTVTRAFILDCRPYYAASFEIQQLWRSTLKELIQTCPCIVGHNLKFDWKFLAYHFGLKLEHCADTMLQELVIYGVGLSKAEDNGVTVNMEDTGGRYGLQVSKDLQKWSVGLDKTEAWSKPFPEDFIQYCVQDVYVPLLIHKQQQEIITSLDLQETAELENNCLPAVARMELDGCFVDKEKWTGIITRKKVHHERLEQEILAELNPHYQELQQLRYETEKQVFDSWKQAEEYILAQLKQRHAEGNTSMQWGKFKNAGMKAFRDLHPRPSTPKPCTEVLNLGSHDQLKQALACIGVNVSSTDRAHLSVYASRVPVVKKLLAWKELDKFINAFGDSLLAKIEDDNRIHPTYNQIGAATGRMSCSSPNWQQIPSHEPEDTSVRKCVVGQGDNVLLTADFSNIEARILADISQDENLLAFFQQGGDLHCTTANTMFNLVSTFNLTETGIELDEKIKTLELKPGLKYRQVAKTINFGLVYGMSPVKLGNTLGVPLEEAEKLFTKYFQAYPGVARWLETASQQALERGYSLTLAGRKRFYEVMELPQYDSDTMSWEQFLAKRSLCYRVNGSYERQAKNAPIQGSNADITKYALSLLHRYLPEYVKIAACVHDEIVLECPQEKAEAVSKVLATAMYKACKRYLKTVHIPAIDVEIEKYWKKG